MPFVTKPFVPAAVIGTLLCLHWLLRKAYRPRTIRLWLASLRMRLQDAYRKRVLRNALQVSAPRAVTAYRAAAHCLIPWRSPLGNPNPHLPWSPTAPGNVIEPRPTSAPGPAGKATPGLRVEMDEENVGIHFRLNQGQTVDAAWELLVMVMAGSAAESLLGVPYTPPNADRAKSFRRAADTAGAIAATEAENGAPLPPHWQGMVPPMHEAGFDAWMSHVFGDEHFTPEQLRILRSAWAKARFTLAYHEPTLERVAAYLLTERRLTGVQMRHLAGPRPPRYAHV